METLNKQVEHGASYWPTKQPSGFSDHLPMALCAIAGLGGSEAELTRFRTSYTPTLSPLDILPTPMDDWRSGIGNADAYPSLRAYFVQAIAQTTREVVVKDVLPHLIESLASHAFHPLIRLGYAIDFRSDDETAVALAYLVSVHRPVPTTADPLNLRAALAAQTRSGPIDFAASGFTPRLIELIDTGNYPVGCAQNLTLCAAAALDAYRSTRDFFALHMVTATHTAGILGGVLEERLLLPALTGALLAAHTIVGRPPLSTGNVAPAPASLDEAHVLKYAWSCHCEYRRYGDPRYLDEIRRFRQSGLLPDWCTTDQLNG